MNAHESPAAESRPLPSCPASLQEVLAYHNDGVVHRFTQLYDITTAEAEAIFHETKKWLWLCAQPGAGRLMMVEPMKIIDEMWHTFILFTLDYMEFCTRYFGVFLHHVPVTGRAKELMAKERARDIEAYARARAAALRAQCEYIHGKLGEATLLEWYVVYPMRYGSEFFAHKHIVSRVEWQPSELIRTLHADASQPPRYALDM